MSGAATAPKSVLGTVDMRREYKRLFETPAPDYARQESRALETSSSLTPDPKPWAESVKAGALVMGAITAISYFHPLSTDLPRQSTDRSAVAQTTQEDPRIAALRNVKDGWDGYEASAPNERSIAVATALLSRLSSLDVEPMRIIESAEGGVMFRFGTVERYAHIEVFDDGEMLAATHEDGQIPDMWDVTLDSVGSAVRRIDEFVRK